MANVPLRGDRAAHDVIGYPHLHGSDLDNNTPLYHLPVASANDFAMFNGSFWVARSAAEAGISSSSHTHTSSGSMMVGILTNGDVDSPEVIFVAGDVITIWEVVA